MAEEAEEEGDAMWNRETVPKVMKIVCSRSLLRQRELISLQRVSSSISRTLLAAHSLWQAIDLREMSDAGIRLILPCRWVTDSCRKHLVRCCKKIVDLNLSGCKNISDTSLELVAANYSDLESLNITRYDRILLQTLTCSFSQKADRKFGSG